MSMAPSVESSSFSQYSSNPTPPVSSQPGVGTGGWFKDHALLILLLVISLVAVLWYLSHRSSTGTATLDNTGYPLGYPSVGAGTSGGSGASSGGSGDTGTGATASDQAIKDFMDGFALRDGQIQPQGASTSTTNTTTTNNFYTTPDPIAPNIITPSPLLPQPITSAPVPVHTEFSGPPPTIQTRSLQVAPTGTSTQALNIAKAGVTPQAIRNATQNALNSVFSSPTTGTHVATTSKPKPAPKKSPSPAKKKAPIGHTRGHEGVY